MFSLKIIKNKETSKGEKMFAAFSMLAVVSIFSMYSYGFVKGNEFQNTPECHSYKDDHIGSIGAFDVIDRMTEDGFPIIRNGFATGMKNSLNICIGE